MKNETVGRLLGFQNGSMNTVVVADIVMEVVAEEVVRRLGVVVVRQAQLMLQVLTSHRFQN